jgi:hypothetical protein
MGHSPTYYVAENPWYLVAILGLFAAASLIALRATQDGRYLARALVALGLAALLIVVEWVWVTEAERVERVIRDLADAVARSDGEAAVGLMDDHVVFGIRSDIRGEELDLRSVIDQLAQVQFDFVRISRLNTSAGAQTHRGQAEFKVTASGSIRQGGVMLNFLGNSEWSIGLRRLPSGEWKINRITAVELPQYTMLPSIKVKLPQAVPGETPREQPATPAPPSPIHRGFGRVRREA